MPLLPRHRLRRTAPIGDRRRGPGARRLLAASLLRRPQHPPSLLVARSVVDFNGELYMTLPGPQGRELYRSDGTPGIATLLKDINPGSGDSPAARLRRRRGLSLLQRGNGAGRNLWRTDGTPAGTVPITRPTGRTFSSPPPCS